MMMGWFDILFPMFCVCHVAVSQVGNACYMRNTGAGGICRISSDCPEVEEQAKNGVDPTVCGLYQLTIPIVCCEVVSTFATGEFQSPSRPVSTVSDNSFSTGINNNNNNNNNNDNFFSNGNVNRPVQTRPTTENPDNFFNSQGSINNFNYNTNDGDSIVYPSDNGQTNDNHNIVPRKSEAKCKEYTKPLNDVVQAIPLLTDTEVVNINIEKCDKAGVPLIVGGEPAALGEFPFMAALGFYVDDATDWRCGATLISEYYVITAAHCTFSRDANQPVVVRLGDVDLTKKNGRYTDYNIVKIITHPDYSYPLRYNDIALIKVDRKIRFSKYIRPACLYTNKYLEESQSIATGYGKTEFAASENLNKLMKVSLDIFDNDRCSQTFGSDKRSLPRGIVSSMICAGELKGGKDTCQGDSGGPLLVTKKNNQCKFYLIGITSFGRACGEANTPAVYTKVSEYISWIENTVWP